MDKDSSGRSRSEKQFDIPSVDDHDAHSTNTRKKCEIRLHLIHSSYRFCYDEYELVIGFVYNRHATALPIETWELSWYYPSLYELLPSVSSTMLRSISFFNALDSSLDRTESIVKDYEELPYLCFLNFGLWETSCFSKLTGRAKIDPFQLSIWGRASSRSFSSKIIIVPKLNGLIDECHNHDLMESFGTASISGEDLSFSSIDIVYKLCHDFTLYGK
ncbi:hypothetical protein Tco_0908391 [Tanacetum coccineum]|uniref:Maturase K n=1 Tax=Tanacetum coccineum TaxID=301880 RepID=A0ABQ5CM24_9ASTR